MFDTQSFRKKNQLTQKEFASKLGLSSTQIASYESGRSMPTDVFLDKIKEVFGYDTEPYKSYNVKGKQVQVVNGDNNKLAISLKDCEKELAVYKEKVANFNELLQSKNETIELLKQQLNKI